MSNYEPMPMHTADLENFTHLFHMVIGGIETHLENDQADDEYVIGSLLALSRQLDLIAYHVIEEYRQLLTKPFEVLGGKEQADKGMEGEKHDH